MAAALTLATALPNAGAAVSPVEPPILEESALAEGGLVLVRLDPRHDAAPGACASLTADDLAVSIDGAPVRVAAVEHVARPDRHWLLIDSSGSTYVRRDEAKRAAARYVREVMTPGIDRAAVVTVSDELTLVSGPSNDAASLASRIDAIPMGGLSALRDGLDMVLRQIAGQRREQLLLYWTDGGDTTSRGSLEDLLATMARAPHVTVFPILLLPSHGLPLSVDNMFLSEIARRSGGEVLLSNDRQWLDRLRGWIERRFLVGLAIPEGTPKGRVSIALRGNACELTVLRDPFADAPAVAGGALDAPRSWAHRHARARMADDAACVSGPDDESWTWPWTDEGKALSGCALDDSRPPRRPAARRLSIAAPPVRSLPSSFEDALLGANPPAVISGEALLVTRARIATSLFAHRNDYREFALAALARRGEDDITAIAADLRRTYPELPADRADRIARASRAGRRALESVEAPTDADLADVLTAWISDIPAKDVFIRWERRLIDSLIANGADKDVDREWSTHRARFVASSGPKTLAPLVLVKDGGVIGFHRIVLPDPDRDYSLGDPEDRIPRWPIALRLVERTAARSSVGGLLREGGYRATSIAEEPAGIAATSSSGEPYRKSHVVVTLEAPGSRRAVLDATLRAADDGSVSIVRLAATVTGDVTLDAALNPDAPPAK